MIENHFNLFYTDVIIATFPWLCVLPMAWPYNGLIMERPNPLSKVGVAGSAKSAQWLDLRNLHNVVKRGHPIV